MKDEFGGIVVVELVGLKSKMYSIKKLMGKNVIQQKEWILNKFNKFKDVLFNQKIIRHKMKRIQSKTHKLGTYEINKISLSCFDDKRYVLDDRIRTLAYFHKDSVTSCNKKEEIKIDCDKEDCDKKNLCW